MTTLRQGSTGAEVLRWQQLLNAAGYPAPQSGSFDAATVESTKSWQRSKNIVADGIVGPTSWQAMVGVAPDPLAAYCREAILAAWPKVTGEQPTLAELQIAAANANLESGCGRAAYTNKQTGEKQVLNNFGAVQRGAPPCNPSTSFEATDTRADGTPYQWCYARYATPEDGAAEMIRQMTVRRPASWAHMRRGDIDAWAEQMRAVDPISGVGLYFEQGASARAKGIDQRVKAIAAAFNEPIAATRGGAPNRPTTAAVASLAGGMGLLGIGLGIAVTTEILMPGALKAALRALFRR